MAKLGAEGALVVAAEAGEFAGEVTELAEALFGVFDRAQGLDVEGEFGGHDGGDVFGDGDAFAGGVEAEVAGLLGGPMGLFAEELIALPVEVATFAPFRDVLGPDRMAAELFGDKFLHFGQLVEPGDDGLASSPFSRRSLICSRMFFGRRAILPVRVFMVS